VDISVRNATGVEKRWQQLVLHLIFHGTDVASSVIDVIQECGSNMRRWNQSMYVTLVIRKKVQKRKSAAVLHVGV
jgi:hypothetical protein